MLQLQLSLMLVSIVLRLYVVKVSKLKQKYSRFITQISFFKDKLKGLSLKTSC